MESNGPVARVISNDTTNDFSIRVTQASTISVDLIGFSLMGFAFEVDGVGSGFYAFFINDLIIFHNFRVI